MNSHRNDAEYTKLPPEFVPLPEETVRPGPEYSAPPPEYGPYAAASAAPRKKRRLRDLLSIPAVAMVTVLALQTVGPGAPSPSEPGTPAETGATEPAATVPVETLPPVPEGTLAFDPEYAGISDGVVHYSYWLHSTTVKASEENNYEPLSLYYPISVYALVTDAEGRGARPETEPDVWTESRSLEDYTLDASGLSGTLTLTLTARYLEDGTEHETVCTVPVAELPPMPQTYAELALLPGGSVDFYAALQPLSGDDHDYDLTVRMMGMRVYDDGEEMGFSLGADPTDHEVTGSRAEGYVVRYSGPSAAMYAPVDAECSVYIVLEDQSTGMLYPIESNRCPIADSLKPMTYPLTEDGKIVLMVYNDTLTFDVPSVVPNDDYMTILALETLPESEFTGYTLPEAPAPKGYTFAGWIVHVGSPFDNGYATDALYAYNGDPPNEVLIEEGDFAFPIGDTLTVEDVERVPVSDDGIRYVNVHATWTADKPSGGKVILDPDNGEDLITIIVDHPLVSEGFLYLATVPAPTREGYTFDGWYDLQGNRVEILNAYFGFWTEIYDDEGNFVEYDWDAGPQPVTLIAHWR